MYNLKILIDNAKTMMVHKESTCKINEKIIKQIIN